MRALSMLLFALLFLLVLILASLATLGFGWLLPLRKRMAIIHATEKAISLLLRLLVGIRVEVHYADRRALEQYRAQQRPLLVVANHQSRWETFYLQGLFKPLVTVLKRELLHMPLLGWALACYWPVALDRAKAISSIKKVERDGVMRLKAGYNLLIFPQATRVLPGEPGYISGGAARLAIRSNAVLVPVVHNAGQYWFGRRLALKPGVIRVDVGEPLDCANKNQQEVFDYFRTFFREHIARQTISANA